MIIINGEEWASQEAYNRHEWLKTYHGKSRCIVKGKAKRKCIKIKELCLYCGKTEYLTTSYNGNKICPRCFLSSL